MRRESAALSLFLACATVAPESLARVVLDGDLSDLAAVAQVDRVDPINELCAVGKSGFDIGRFLAFYDSATDGLFFGIDVMDVLPGVGIAGPGVPGDADGDNRADAPATNPNCVSPPASDEDGVGPDEEYIVLLDTDENGVFLTLQALMRDIGASHADGLGVPNAVTLVVP